MEVVERVGTRHDVSLEECESDDRLTDFVEAITPTRDHICTAVFLSD
jgi:hypothetical protein